MRIAPTFLNAFWIATLPAGAMFADTITSGSGTMTAFPTGFSSSTPGFFSALTPPATPPNAFWNNCSFDSDGSDHEMNVGDLLSNTGGFSGGPPVLGPETVAMALTNTGQPVAPAFNFVRNSTSYNITLLFADSSLDTGNASVGTVFGSYAGGVFSPIYTVGLTSSPTGTRGFNPATTGNSYGFYATVCYALGVCETYTTGDGNWGNAPGGSGWNHFALFQLANGNYVIGLEDANGIFAEGNGDYNDVVVELSSVAGGVAVPEPGNLGIVILSLTAMVVLMRRSGHLDRRPQPKFGAYQRPISWRS